MCYNFKRIVGKKMFLSPMRSDDEAIRLYCGWVANEKFNHFIGVYTEVFDMAKEKKFVEQLLKEPNGYWFNIVTDNDILIGNCSLEIKGRTNAELGIMIGNITYQNGGFGKEVVSLLLRFAFDELRLHRVELNVASNNTRAIGCYIACGFRKYATIKECWYHEGEWHDADLMEVNEKDWKELRSILFLGDTKDYVC